MSQIIEEQLIAVANQIEELVYMHDIDYIDACIMFCNQNNLEYEHVGEIVREHANLRSKIQAEAETLHYVKKTDRLAYLSS